MRSSAMTPEDRAILSRLPMVIEAQYRHADTLDASMTRRMMRSGSIVFAVCSEEAALQVRVQRQAIYSSRTLGELVAAAQV
jgi:hypothetical protein